MAFLTHIRLYCTFKPRKMLGKLSKILETFKNGTQIWCIVDYTRIKPISYCINSI